jgi:hypothetical protein
VRPPESEASLNARRDTYTRGMRALMEEVPGAMPRETKGILGRMEAIIDAQRPALDTLDGLDLDNGRPSEEAAMAIVRSQQLPRMILAFGEVLVQDEKDESLRPIQIRCLELARGLAFLSAEWFERHQDKLDLTDL